MIFIILIVIAGFLLFIVGLLAAYPVVLFSQAAAYEKLRQKLLPATEEELRELEE